MDNVYMHDDVLVVAEKGALGHPEVTVNASVPQVLGIITKLVDVVADHMGLPYNEVLDDLKEIQEEQGVINE